MNLPNRLTLIRLVLTAMFVAVLSCPPFLGRYTLGLALFVIAAITDFLDGYFARKLNLITNFGKLMDPLADKVLVMAGFVLLCKLTVFIPAWAVILILAREFLVTGLRLLAASHGRVVAAENLGKYKTTAQLVTLIYFQIVLATSEPWLNFLAFLNDFLGGPIILGTLFLAVVVILTVWSGASFLVKNWTVIQD